MPNNISNYYKSFSGTDSLVFLMIPFAAPVCLGSITTISYSMSRDKRPVPLIGKINVGGFTRGTRIVAGTMIFTMINQQWVNDLLDQIPWLKEYGPIKADELPLFDVMIVSANEYGASVEMFIYGVDITDEGQVLSIEDLFTENQFSFVARDLDTFTNYKYNNDNLKKKPRVKKVGGFGIGYNRDFNPSSFKSDRVDLYRNYRLDNSNLISGDDVLGIQKELNKNGVESPENGIYDSQTAEAVKDYQALVGLEVTGALDDDTYKSLTDKDKKDKERSGVVISKQGAQVHEQANLKSKVLKKLSYKDRVNVLSVDGDWVETEDGFLLDYQIYTKDKSSIAGGFKPIRKGDKGATVTMLQEALLKIGYEDVVVNGYVDDDTVKAINDFKGKSGMLEDGIVDTETWLALQKESEELSPELLFEDYGFDIFFKKLPSTHKIRRWNMGLNWYGMTLKRFTRDVSCKITAVAYYPNSSSKLFSKTIDNIKGEKPKDITPALLEEAFMYDPRMESEPNYVEFIFYPTGGEPLKWSFEIVD